MTWGVDQLRDLVGGMDDDEIAKSGKLQVRDLVLVDNVKVCIFFMCLFFHSKIGSPTVKETSCLRSGYAVESWPHKIS